MKTCISSNSVLQYPECYFHEKLGLKCSYAMYFREVWGEGGGRENGSSPPAHPCNINV